MWKWLALAALASTPYGLTAGAPPIPAPVPVPAPAPVCASEHPAPNRACTADADCAIVSQVVSCCGTVGMRGIRKDDVARFSEENSRCNPGRHCGCINGPDTLDDGNHRRDHRQPVVVSCRANLCTTSLGPAPAAACTPAECGPAPLYPTGTCPDGVHQFGRGPCARVGDRCGWTRLACP